MNRSSQITKFQHSFKMSLWKSFLVTIIALSTITANAQGVDCNTIMACNDLVQISLNVNCTETVTPSMILEDQLYANSDYTVVTSTPNGSVISNNVLTRTHIGKTYQVVVTLNGCDLSCWGSITVEDKLPPVISACPSVTVNCGQSTAPGAVTRPTAVDACSGNATLTSSDKEVVSQCSAAFVKVITRTWTATDAYGNKSTCQQTINVTRPTITSVTFPQDFVDGNSFTCGAQIKYTDKGAPHPDVTGYPGGADCANIMYYYDDVIFNICGAAKKVLRQWTVIDWCTGRDTTAAQIIKIIDDAPPICVSPSDFQFNIFTDEGKCTGTFKVPAPTIAFECSNYDYVVGYKLRTANGTPFVNPIFDNVTKTTNADGTYFYTIRNLPADTTWVVYQITDACGNYTECFTEVVVKDKEAPSAVCEGFTVVSIEDNGLGDLSAVSVDDGSSDNCGIDKFQIRRETNNCGRPEDLIFRDKVYFCCADVSPTVYQKVVLRVFDKGGLFSDCTANVKIQDKKAPTITDVPDVTIQCDQDFKNLALTNGRPIGKDNCNLRIDSTDVVNLKCGLGTIRRTWRVTDNQGTTATSVQIITITDNTPFGPNDITWPQDLEANGCLAADATPDKLNSKPTFKNVDCVDLAVSWTDEEFSVPGACLKVLRTWRVVNWCDANPQNPTFITYVQKITLRNSIAPVFVDGCAPRTINSPENDCEQYVEHKVTATDDCTPSNLLKYTWTYDEDNNGTINQTGTGSIYGRVYPAGKHKMTFKVKDICENTAECSYIFTVKDNKAPTPICNAQITWVLDEKGKAEVWASDFDLKSEDLCDGDDLFFSFTADGSQPAKNFTCADVPNGLSAAIPLKMYVIDGDGNSEFCNVTLILQDSPNKNACPNTATSNLTISGKIVNKIDEGFKAIDINVINVNDNTSKVITTEENGNFTITDLPVLNNYVLSPVKDNDIMNGISTLDLVLIQRHILGVKPLENPYDIIAADVNKDKKVTASDLVSLRKVILSVEENFTNNKPWRFVPANYNFADPKNPHDFPASIELNNLESDANDINFTTVKTGDVNNSASYNFNSSVNVENRTSPAVLLMNSNRTNEYINVSLKVAELVKTNGLQLALNYNNKDLKFVGINSSTLEIDGNNYNEKDGLIKISLDSRTAAELNTGDEVINLTFKANSKDAMSNVTLSETSLENEMYDEEYNSRGIVIENITTENSKNVVFEVKALPNPFTEQTTLEFGAKSEGTAILKVIDATGKVVHSKNEQVVKGSNKISIRKENLNGQTGIYFYQLQLEGQVKTGAIILSE